MEGTIKSYFNTGAKLSITKIEKSGEIITLSDRSKWQIETYDKFNTMMWMTMDEVMVTAYIGSKYTIKNTKRNQEAKANLIEK